MMLLNQDDAATIWRHDIQHNDSQHNDIQHNNTQQKGLICDNQNK